MLRVSSFFVVLTAILFMSISAASPPILPAYFNYTHQEIEPLKALESSDSTATISDLKLCDRIMYDKVKKKELGDKDAALIYAYVYVAQRDALAITAQLKKNEAVNLFMITEKVLCYFLEKNCDATNANNIASPYSEALSKVILEKIKLRHQADLKGRHLYPVKTGEGYWQGTPPYFGQDTGSWKTWLIGSINNFKVPEPPPYDDERWQQELAQTVTARKNATTEQKIAVVRWAGGPGTITPPGQWLLLANNYMFQNKELSLARISFIRSILAMSLVDSGIAVFNAKYLYWVKRPFMRDKTLTTVMPTPNHPSYPAGHSTFSATAATILIHYLPENKTMWEAKAQEASNSRIWGGIHYNIDAVEGFILGKKVGEAAIKVAERNN
ncbi:MAG: vanadium-dependent haloperoxidase [Proteobacteria bacterium]|nr:vanadium-dependent haloperoxidase [Pseudomonadota bacterium]